MKYRTFIVQKSMSSPLKQSPRVNNIVSQWSTCSLAVWLQPAKRRSKLTVVKYKYIRYYPRNTIRLSERLSPIAASKRFGNQSRSLCLKAAQSPPEQCQRQTSQRQKKHLSTVKREKMAPWMADDHYSTLWDWLGIGYAGRVVLLRHDDDDDQNHSRSGQNKKIHKNLQFQARVPAAAGLTGHWVAGLIVQ